MPVRWGRSRRHEGRSRDVIREAERLLDGRTLESFIARRERVPAWSLVSLLGHGTRADLMRLAAPVPRPEPGGWSDTVARLAGDVIGLSRDDRSLLQLQRRSLVPLELCMLAGTIGPPSTPGELYQMVTGSLDRPPVA